MAWTCHHPYSSFIYRRSCESQSPAPNCEYRVSQSSLYITLKHSHDRGLELNQSRRLRDQADIIIRLLQQYNKQSKYIVQHQITLRVLVDGISLSPSILLFGKP